MAIRIDIWINTVKYNSKAKDKLSRVLIYDTSSIQISRGRVAIQHQHNGKTLTPGKTKSSELREPNVKTKISLLEENVSIGELLRRKYGKTSL